MHTGLTLKTRREFLRATAWGCALTWTVPAFLAKTFAALEAEADDRAIPVPTGKDSPILVVLQMAGGNDGLNTVIPYSNDYYFRARPKLGQEAEKILKLNDMVGLHASLKNLKALYDDGHLAVVQGVGYPNPNRSHFRATEIWQTASDAREVAKYGWLGRYFDNCCAGADPTVGVTIGSQMPQAFAAQVPRGISMVSPENYRFGPVNSDPGKFNLEEEILRDMNQPENEGSPPTLENSGGTIGGLGGASGFSGSVLNYLERTALAAEISADEIHRITQQTKNQAAYPASPLANGLKLIARLVGGGLPTRIYYLSQGGYDTHTNQMGAQARLLENLADAIKAFVDDLKAQGNFERVLLMTFSEFGRRVAENANGGTDHGAAAPLFVVGPRLKPGLLSQYPSLAPEDLLNGDLKYTLDFRSVYAAVLEQWLQAPSELVLGKRFAPLPLI